MWTGLDTPSRAGLRGLHIAGLCALALGQPLLDLLNRHPTFLVAHGARSDDVAALLIGLLVGLPAVLWLLLEMAWRVWAPLGRALYLGTLGALAGVLVLPMLTRVAGFAGFLGAAVALVLGASAAVAYGRLETLRRLATLLGASPLIFGTIFAFGESGRALLFGRFEPVESPHDIVAEAPVVMVVLDELPLTSLLDEREEVDPLRYPAFARLAREGTWYRDATTTHASTRRAVPAILTGRLGRAEQLPIAAHHRLNLFTLLQGRYEIHAVEALTSIVAPAAETGAQRWARWRGLLSDLRVIGLHLLLPGDLGSGLPPIRDTWRDFDATELTASSLDPGRAFKNRLNIWRRFVASIEPRETPTLHFLHVMLPHRPWHYLPSGQGYHCGAMSRFWAQAHWSGNPWRAAEGQQRHLLQLGMLDALLGELLQRLDDQGLYDSTLLVVTADHGASFWPGESLRDPTQSRHAEEILSVPLFIKAPQQREAETDERPVELIDILPTLADHLGFQIPWDVDGCSLLEPSCRARPGSGSDLGGDPVEEGASPRRWRRDGLDRKLDLFGSGSRRDGLFALGSDTRLIGRRVERGSSGRPIAGRALVEREGIRLATLNPERFALACISGELEIPDGGKRPRSVAVAVAGVVRGVAPVLMERSGGRAVVPTFSVMLPESGRPASADGIELFAVMGTPEIPTLEPLESVSRGGSKSDASR